MVETRFGLEYGQGSVYGPEEEAAVLEVLRAGAPGYGPRSAAFEAAFAGFVGVPHAIAVSSGTAALELAMIALGIGPGDEVITTPLSWMSTANAAAARGAGVVFADIDPRRYTLDPEKVAALVTPRTRAIVAVHLYGQCTAMDSLVDLARRHGLALIEDCAHAPGARYGGRMAGSMGDVAIFSFGQQKNMTTLGEGGMVVTGRRDLAQRVREHRWICARGYAPAGRYGLIEGATDEDRRRYWHLEFDEVGLNRRMTEMQAAAGLVQLGKLAGLNARRAEIARRYNEGLAGTPGLELPWVDPACDHAWHVYCARVDRRDEFMTELLERFGVKPWVHYRLIHLTGAYRALGHGPGECPVAEALAGRIVSLPIHPRLSDEAVEHLISSVRAVCG